MLGFRVDYGPQEVSRDQAADELLLGLYSTGVDLTFYGFTLHAGEITGR